MSILVPKSMKKGLTLEEVQAFYSLTPIDSDDPSYDFNKQIEKVLKNYAKSNVKWNCDTSIANGKCIIRAMINHEDLRWNKKRTGYKPTWKLFDNWRKNRILAYSNITDEERKIMEKDIISLETSTETKLKNMSVICSKQKKDIQKLKEENAKLKLLLMKYEGVEEVVDPVTGEENANFVYDDLLEKKEQSVPLHFNIKNSSAEDYLNSDDPHKLLMDTKDKAFQQLVEIFTIHRKGVFFNNCDELCDIYDDFLNDEEEAIPVVPVSEGSIKRVPIFNMENWDISEEVDLLEAKFDELKTD